MKKFLLSSAALLLSSPALATCPALMQNGTPVVDSANVLTPEQELGLVQQLTAVNSVGGHQVAVFTVPSLNGEDPADCSNKALREWGLGSRNRNDGVLLMLSVGDRKSRIEVGYGLEPTLTDAQSNLINRGKMVPYFRRGDWAGGLGAGVEAVGQVINTPPPLAAASLAPPSERHTSSVGLLWWLLGGMGGLAAFAVWRSRVRAERARAARLREQEILLERARLRSNAEELKDLVESARSRAEKPRPTGNRRVGKEPALGAPYGGQKPKRREEPSNYSPPPSPPPYSPPPSPPPSSSWSSSDSSSSSSSFGGDGGSSGGGGDTSSF